MTADVIFSRLDWDDHKLCDCPAASLRTIPDMDRLESQDCSLKSPQFLQGNSLMQSKNTNNNDLIYNSEYNNTHMDDTCHNRNLFISIYFITFFKFFIDTKHVNIQKSKSKLQFKVTSVCFFGQFIDVKKKTITI